MAKILASKFVCFRNRTARAFIFVTLSPLSCEGTQSRVVADGL